jgi:SAM-dependent methyltransferase
VIEAARVGMESVGCDLSVEGVVHAARFAEDEGVAGSAGFVVCAAERLPFPDRSFSCASAVAVLEHLDDDGAAVAELARVLAPGARLWVTVPLAFRYMPPFLWPVYWVHDRRLGHKRHYDDGRLRALLHAHGFEHVRTDYTGHPVKVLQFAASAVSRRVRVRGSRLWWRLEERDLRGARRPLWALQLSMVARRAA